MKSIKVILGISIVMLILGFTNPKIDITSNSITSLFKIERSKDSNQIFYDVNLDNAGVLDSKAPISVYWKRNTEGGTIKPLTWIQQKFAYGLRFLNVNDEYATFQFVSYDKLSFTLKKKKGNQYEVYTKYNSKLLKMDRIYIQLDGGTFWFPNITAVEIYAKDVATGEDVIEIINP